MEDLAGNDVPATQQNLLHLAQKGLLDRRAYERALKIAGYTPNANQWNSFLNVLLLILGAGFAVAGIYFFFAYNWADMHRFVKLGIIEVLIAGLVISAHAISLEKLTGKIALTVAGLLIGALLAVYGQIYQTGADAYTLFLGWTLLMAGWVFISKFTPMWFLWIVLINTSLLLYWDQVVGFGSEIYLWLFSINALFVLVWEGFARNVDWLISRWTPRLLSLIVFYALTVPVVFVITQSEREPILFLMTVLFVLVNPIVIYVYSRKYLDLFMLTLSAISLMVVSNTWLANVVDAGDFTPLIIGVFIIAQTALAVALLVRISRSQEARTK
ncbi:MAG TPA: DUF2157 domain-containing protein [Anaerolineales bacterium]|nr:DUF2157 domain-containing protein [Anaerolineales bacterium]